MQIYLTFIIFQNEKPLMKGFLHALFLLSKSKGANKGCPTMFVEQFFTPNNESISQLTPIEK
jgi:hypothetical protein